MAEQKTVAQLAHDYATALSLIEKLNNVSLDRLAIAIHPSAELYPVDQMIAKKMRPHLVAAMTEVEAELQQLCRDTRQALAAAEGPKLKMVE